MQNTSGKTGLHLPLQKCMEGEDIRLLADHELLAIILNTGIRNHDVIQIAGDMVRDFGGFNGLFNAGLRELAGKPGIGLKKAIRIHAAIEMGRRFLSRHNVVQTVDSPEKVWRLLHPEMVFLQREEFRVLVLNNKNHLLKKCTVSIGTVSEAIIHPREIFREAIKEAGASIIVAHNHPSGVLTPSGEDITSTGRIKEAGTIIGIELLDHVIIGGSSYLSLKEAGYL